MCGRAYATYIEEELEARYLTKKRHKKPLGEFAPNYNIAPTQLVPVILRKTEEPEIEFFRWGLIPSWAKDIKSAAQYSLMNAKGEEIETKRSFKDAFLLRRCIVPVSGFFEWQAAEGGVKRPFAIHLKDNSIMSLAGIWETWGKLGENQICSFSIITTQANFLVEKVHDRMPVILKEEDESAWLNPENRDPLFLKGLLKPYPSEQMSLYEISTLVNSPKNNVKEVLAPKIS